MRSSDRRLKRSRSIDSESEDEGTRPRQRTSRRRNSTEGEAKLPSTSLLTLSLLAILGARNLLPSPTDLAEMDAYRGNMDFPMGYKARPQRLRYRDDMSMVRHSMMKNGQEWNPYMMETEPVMMMPVAVAERGRVNPLARSVLSPTTSAHSSRQQDPSLEDIELIDLLWRGDIAAEKGQSQYTPSDQYEHDLQLLTEKSVREPLTTSESARYEDLAKGYFEDFFFPVSHKGGHHLGGHDDMRREMSTPTDEDLDALLEDVTKEGGQLDQLCPNGLEPSGPLHNITLGQGIIFDANNATYEMSAPCATSLGDGELFSNGTMDSPSWQNNLGPSDNTYISVFPTGPQDSVFPMFAQNDTSVPIISTGVHFNHSYTSSQVSPSPDAYSSSYYVPNNYNESSVCSSSTTSRSPTYMSDTENMPPVSRYYGKLAPTPAEYHHHEEEVKELKDEADLSSPVPRRRGRQSKDEQLAKMNHLPLSAKEIAEMSLADLQKMLKSEKLTDTQKALIKKIRRRGKNKVAARTCRQRRGDKITKNGQEWMDPSQLSLDA